MTDETHQKRFKTECCGYFVDVESSIGLDSVTVNMCPECGMPGMTAYEV